MFIISFYFVHLQRTTAIKSNYKPNNMNLKTSYLKSISAVCILFFLGCQSDDTKETEYHKSGISIKRKEFGKFQRLPELLSKALPEKQTRLSRGANPDPLYDFEIDSTSVTEMSSNGQTFYTMAVKRENSSDDSFENLIVSENADGTGNTAYLVKYFPAPEYYERLKTSAHPPYVGGMSLQEIDYGSVFQKRGSTIQTCVNYTWAFCGNTDNCGPAGEGCYANEDGGAHIITVTLQQCFDNPVTGSEPEKFVDISPGGTGGGGNGGNTPVYPNPTDPTEENPLNPNTPQNPGLGDGKGNIISEPVLPSSPLKDFKAGLDDRQLAWWNNIDNKYAVASIIDYLNENNNANAKEFAEKMIDLAIEDNSTFRIDNTIDENNALVFNSVEDFKSFVNAESEGEATISYEQELNQKVVDVTFRINPLIDLKIKVKQTMSPYSISNVTSAVVGITFGNGWEQSDFSVNINSNIVTIDIYGTSTVSVFVEGIGTIYTKERHYQIKINKTTGVVIATLVL